MNTSKKLSRAEQIFTAFKIFHKEHPSVWELFKAFSFEEIRRGKTHYSANAIFERIRLHTKAGDARIGLPKLNNNFRAYYARLFHTRYPEYGNFFGLRLRVSESRFAYKEDMQFIHGGPPDPSAEFRIAQELSELED